MQRSQAKKQRQDLPYEIWLHIASFLPWTTTQNLLSLNRAFLNHILRARFRAIHVGDFTNPRSRVDLERLLYGLPLKLYENCA
jgi:hypothetical protein